MASSKDAEKKDIKTTISANETTTQEESSGTSLKPALLLGEIGNFLSVAGPSDDKVDTNEAGTSKATNEVVSSRASDSGGEDGPRACKRERREEQSSNSEACAFPSRRGRPHHRRYRNHHSSGSESGEEKPNEGQSSSSSASEPDVSSHPDAAVSTSSDDSAIGERLLELLRSRYGDSRGLDSDDTWSMLDSDDSDSDLGGLRVQELPDTDEEDNEENLKYQKCLQKEKPKHQWCVTKEVMNRQMGLHTQRQEPELFWQHCYSSLHCVKRLELMYKLDEHNGCVNAISFNRSGTRLASGSDDKRVIVWDWATGRSLVKYNSGHTSNVFQTKFLPLSGDTHMVSSARDGQVRLAVLSSTGECRSTKRLAQHRKAVHKLCLQPETPHVFLTAGEDGMVMTVDVRNTKPSHLVCVKDDAAKIGLYSIDVHPLNANEFCVCGVDYFIRIYDKRKIKPDGRPLKKFCPHHILGTSKYTNVTCAVYNHDGTEIVGSYSDESIYLFDSRHEDGADFVHKYEGHRNSATVKSCNFYGPNSEYVISGSDCGNIFFWDKHTEAIVQFMRGDEKGVVNHLISHPQIPILATCGLDSDVKIWVPSCEQDSEMKNLRKVVINNIRDRVENRPDRIDAFERHFEQLRHIQLRRVGISEQLRTRFMETSRRSRRQSSSSSDSESDRYSTSRQIQCPQS